jgi:hypothetical protein
LQWHQEFIENAARIFGEAPTSAPHPANATKTTDMPSLQKELVLPSPVWGIRINKSRSYSLASPSSSKDPPSWRGRAGKSEWQECGVVVWDESIRKMAVLTANEALRILGSLRERGYWRTSGIAITQRGYAVKLSENARQKGASEEKAAEETIRSTTVCVGSKSPRVFRRRANQTDQEARFGA